MTATPPARKLVVELGVALVVAVALDGVIAAIAHAAGASHAFTPLNPASYISLTVIGMLAGTAGWALVRAKVAHPRRVLGRLVPTVLALSLVPDAIVGISSVRGASWGAVAALMLMHVVVATVLVAALLRALPLTDNGDPHVTAVRDLRGLTEVMGQTSKTTADLADIGGRTVPPSISRSAHYRCNQPTRTSTRDLP